MTDRAPTPGAADPLDLHGVVPPTITAFDESGALDIETTVAHAEFVVDSGVHGVFPLGTNGEFALLSDAERDRVVTAVTEAVKTVPVIAGVGAPSTRRTISHADHAESVGADGVVVVTPYYYPLDHAAAVEHYCRVTEAIDLPVYIYHIPGRTGNTLALETLDVIAAMDGIAGMKDSSKDVPWLGQAIDRNPELTALVGSDSLLFAGLEIGCAGAVSAVANVFPELVVDLYEAYDAGDELRARAIQSTIFEVRRALKAGPDMAGVKTALRLRGFDGGGLRRPLRTFDAEGMATLETTLEEIGVL